jgi:tRNA pseudouridine38-40 synthase
MKFFLNIGFDGTEYSGWQWQPNVPSIQEEIEKALHSIFKYKVTVFGCGRTDAGVHASQYILHIELKTPPDFDLKFRLNKNLPDAIAVYEIIEMNDDRHARYDATSRTYDYFIHTYEDSVLHKYSSFYELKDLDIEAMKQAVELLPKYQDYHSMCKQPLLHNHTLCKITQAKLYVNSDHSRLRFSITADRFLRGMIRLIIYFLVKVGTKEISLIEFEHLLSNKIDLNNKIPAFPNGLYLSKVEYPYLKIELPTTICSLLKMDLNN